MAIRRDRKLKANALTNDVDSQLPSRNVIIVNNRLSSTPLADRQQSSLVPRHMRETL